ncbi:MAG: hypothetical protein ACE5EF_05375 [Dehalococcoidia bacterium]
MRFLLTVVSAAILIFIIYLVIGTIVDGYFGGNIVPNSAEPEAWAAPDSWSEWRDIFLVLAAVAWVLAGLVTVALMVALVMLVVAVRRVLNENAAPAIDSLRGTLDNARGTSEFVGESVVSPIIRIYSIFSGVRSGLQTVTSLPKRVRSRRRGKK